MRSYSREACLILIAVAVLLTMGFLSIVSVDIGLGLSPEIYRAQRDYAFSIYICKLLAGLLVLIAVSRLDRAGLARVLRLAAIVTTAAFLLILATCGLAMAGACQWATVRNLAPAAHETGKLALLLLLARVLAGRESESALELPARRFWAATTLIALFTIPALVLFPGIIAIHFLVTGIILLFLAGVRQRHLAVLSLLVGVGALAWRLATGPGYRIKHYLSFSGPVGEGYQALQAKLALASGGLWGLGLGQGRQKQLFLSDATTSAMGAAIGEELGLVGLLAIFILFTVICLPTLRIAGKFQDRFFRLLFCGSAAILFTECLLHLAGVSGLISTGLNLPFVSQASDGHLINFALVGVLWGAGKKITAIHKGPVV